MNGKGDAPRPLSVDVPTYHTNWDRIFGTTQSTCEYSGLANTATYENKKGSKIQDTYNIRINDVYIYIIYVI